MLTSRGLIGAQRRKSESASRTQLLDHTHDIRLVSTHRADASTEVYVRRYDDVATLKSDAERYFDAYVNDSSAKIDTNPLDPPAKTTWGEGASTDDGSLYTVVTDVNGTKSPTMIWTMEDKGIMLIAQSSAGSMETLYKWWTGA